jgi:hypothetical protein
MSGTGKHHVKLSKPGSKNQVKCIHTYNERENKIIIVSLSEDTMEEGERKEILENENY